MNAWSTNLRPVLTVALLTSVTGVTCAENITYSLVPRSIHGIGQAAELEPSYVFGELTTNGTLGHLSSDDIVYFRIEVTGPVPYVFVPENSDLHLSDNLSGTVSQVLVSQPGDGVIVGSLSGERLCRWSDQPCLEWWFYQDWFFNDAVQGVVEYGNSSSLPFEGRWTLEVLQDQFQTPSVPFIVAEIPEPSAFTLATIAVMGLLNQAKRRNRTHAITIAQTTRREIL